jgi:hypothetical protein
MDTNRKKEKEGIKREYERRKIMRIREKEERRKLTE